MFKRSKPVRRRTAIVIALAVVLIAVAAVAWEFRSSGTRLTAHLPSGAQSGALPSPPQPPRSVIVVIDENKSYKDIIGNTSGAPYINALAEKGALFTESYAVAHPSQPNYFAIFARLTNDDGDTCPAHGIPADHPNLGSEAIGAGKTFRAYSEDLPYPGFTGCTSGEYARKHAPWVSFSNVPATLQVPFSALTSYDGLPNLAFIIPNLLDDMHSASIARGDAWLRTHIDPIVTWAATHNALVILTFDESSAPLGNHIPTLFVGPMVKPGRYAGPITHLRLHDTIEWLFALPPAAGSAAQPIVDVWRPVR
jgi:hypothetical protein